MKNGKDAPTALAPVTEERKPHTLLSVSKLFITFLLRPTGKNSVTFLENQRVRHLGVFTGFTQRHNFQIVRYIAK